MYHRVCLKLETMGPGKCLGGVERESLRGSAMAVWNTITPRVDADVGGVWWEESARQCHSCLEHH